MSYNLNCNSLRGIYMITLSPITFNILSNKPFQTERKNSLSNPISSPVSTKDEFIKSQDISFKGTIHNFPKKIPLKDCIEALREEAAQAINAGNTTFEKLEKSSNKSILSISKKALQPSTFPSFETTKDLLKESENLVRSNPLNAVNMAFLGEFCQMLEKHDEALLYLEIARKNFYEFPTENNFTENKLILNTLPLEIAESLFKVNKKEEGLLALENHKHAPELPIEHYVEIIDKKGILFESVEQYDEAIKLYSEEIDGPLSIKNLYDKKEIYYENLKRNYPQIQEDYTWDILILNHIGGTNTITYRKLIDDCFNLVKKDKEYGDVAIKYIRKHTEEMLFLLNEFQTVLKKEFGEDFEEKFRISTENGSTPFYNFYEELKEAEDNNSNMIKKFEKFQRKQNLKVVRNQNRTANQTSK